MVFVHAAATWQPSNISQTSLLGILAGAIGGLAAPLFVTLFGWGLANSSLNIKKNFNQSLHPFFSSISFESIRKSLIPNYYTRHPQPLCFALSNISVMGEGKRNGHHPSNMHID